MKRTPTKHPWLLLSSLALIWATGASAAGAKKSSSAARKVSGTSGSNGVGLHAQSFTSSAEIKNDKTIPPKKDAAPPKTKPKPGGVGGHRVRVHLSK